jgi:hypothetical protein
MNQLRQLFFCILTIFATAIGSSGKEWRAILPMHSTKSDVIHRLGSPAEENENRLIYHLDKEDVLIVLSGSKFCNYKNSEIPPGTVLMIQVTPREKFAFKEIRNEGKNWKTFEPSPQDSSWVGYMDDEEGLLVRTFQDSVDRIFYIPTAKERAACPPYYDRPEEMARIILDFSHRPFDRYSNLAFADEKARLDNLAIFLEDKPAWKAYIVVHPGRKKEDTRSRTSRTTQYLISLGLTEERISIIIGAPQDEATTELYALPPDAPPPNPNF